MPLILQSRRRLTHGSVRRPQEKRSFTQAGRAAAEKAPKEESIEDLYAKAPHGDSSDDDEVLEAKLRSLSEIPHPRPSSEARSDKAAYDEEEHHSVPSSSPAKRDKRKKRAKKATNVQSATGDEPMKRKKKSKHGSKKAARKGPRSRPSQVPEADEYELDMEGVPRDKLERTLTAMHRVNQGLKASSDRAESAVSGMTRTMTRLTKARDDERGWLKEENRILKDLVGWKKSASRAASPPPSSSEEETASLEEDEDEEEAAPFEEVRDA